MDVYLQAHRRRGGPRQRMHPLWYRWPIGLRTVIRHALAAPSSVRALPVSVIELPVLASLVLAACPSC